MPTNNTRRRKPTSTRTTRGRGDYSDEVQSIVKPLPRLEAKIDHLEKSLARTTHTTPTIAKGASTIGRTLGNFLNQGDLGALAGESLAKYFGHGDYHVKSNSLMSSVTRGADGPVPPKFSKSGKRGTRIVEREFLGDIFSGALVNGSSAFTNILYTINPTDRKSFPWLSTIANQFDQWDPNGIIFEFVSTSSTFNGTSQALGTVIMATDYDVYDPLYPSKQIMENSDYSCSTRPSENLVHGVECAISERPTKILYTSTTGTKSLEDLANFQIATVGCSTANARLGELWVSYDITFYKKQLTPVTTTLSKYSAGGDLVQNMPYINLPNVRIQRDIFIQPIVGVGSRILFPPDRGSGRYLYTYYLSVYATNDDFNPLAFSSCSVISQRYAGQAGFPYIIAQVFEVTGPNAYFDTRMRLSPLASIYSVSILEVPEDFTL